MSDLPALAGKQFCYLTTTGRKTGSPHEIEIWFALEDATIDMLHDSGMSSDTVRNLLTKPRVTVRIATARSRGRLASSQGPPRIRQHAACYFGSTRRRTPATFPTGDGQLCLSP